MTTVTPLPTFDDVRQAADRLRGVAHRTPVMRSRTVDARLQASVFFKCENLQRAGAFKFRGAYNALSQLGPAARRAGALGYSSGNHAQAMALAAEPVVDSGDDRDARRCARDQDGGDSRLRRPPSSPMTATAQVAKYWAASWPKPRV